MSYCSFFIRGFDLKTYPAAIDFDDRRFAHHLFTDGCCLGMLYMNFNTYGISPTIAGVAKTSKWPEP